MAAAPSPGGRSDEDRIVKMPRPVNFPDEGVGILFHGLKRLDSSSSRVRILGEMKNRSFRGDGCTMSVSDWLPEWISLRQVVKLVDDTQGSARTPALGMQVPTTSTVWPERARAAPRLTAEVVFPDSALAADQADDPAFAVPRGSCAGD